MAGLPITREECVPLAISDFSDSTIWPVALYPCADDALAADVAGDFADEDLAGVQICWAYQVANHPEGPGWWLWSYREHYLPDADPQWPERELESPPVECWEVS